MSIDKLSSRHTKDNSALTSLADINDKVNEVIDVVNEATDGSETMQTLTATTSVVTNTISEYTATAGVTVDGLLIKDGKITPTIGTITQDTSIVTGVVLNTPYGIITTVSSTLAASSFTGFTLTNSSILSTSIILLSIVGYQGDGIPSVTVHTAFDGSVALRLNNSHATDALNQPVKIAYQII